jgi:adenylylsulfate kinase
MVFSDGDEFYISNFYYLNHRLAIDRKNYSYITTKRKSISVNTKLIMNQRGVTIWLTGLSGAGKTTISKAVAEKLRSQSYRLEILDGDIVRQNLTKGLGFSKADRDENIRRIGFVSHLLTRNGVIVLVSAISPYSETRLEVKQKIGDFIEVYVNAPLKVCEERDVKGLYKQARAGEITNFTGIDDPYEAPVNPTVECRTDLETVEESVVKVLDKLEELGYFSQKLKVAVV